MTRKHKATVRRIVCSAAVFLVALLIPGTGPLRLGLYLTSYVMIGYDILKKAAVNILHGQVFDENFLMAVATVGAWGCGEYPEAVAVMLFYQVGELFQSIAVARSRRSIAALMEIRPDYANIERDGRLIQVATDKVAPGELIVIRPGERIPLDGAVEEGTSALDTAALTGEAMPRDASVGDSVLSGCINLSGVLRVRVTKPFKQSTVCRILELVENSVAKKAKAEHFITRFARYYTSCVVFSALALAVLPPLLGLVGFSVWGRRALVFLVVSCPCALVISVPLTFFGGIGCASRRGILVKGGNYLEALAKTGIVVFDKTGTLTQGTFCVSEIRPVSMSETALLQLAAAAEQFSSHPIALSIRAAAGNELPAALDVQELPGHGVRVRVDGKTVLSGNEKLMLSAAVAVARKTLGIVRQNIALALGIKFLVLALSAVGRANMWMAVFADVGVAVIAILNAGRMLK